MTVCVYVCLCVIQLQYTQKHERRYNWKWNNRDVLFHLQQCFPLNEIELLKWSIYKFYLKVNRPKLMKTVKMEVSRFLDVSCLKYAALCDVSDMGNG